MPSTLDRRLKSNVNSTFIRKSWKSYEAWDGMFEFVHENGFVHENILTVNASVHPVFGPHICPSPSRPSARWASGPRSPLAPTVPFSGTSDTQPAKQKQNSTSLYEGF